MACAEENLKAIWGEASRHTCKASPVHYNLDRPKLLVPTGHHAGKGWPHTTHDLRSCFRTNVSQHMPARGSKRIAAAA